MGTFQGAPDVTAVMAAGNAMGLYDEKAVQALAAVPGVEWDTGVPAADAAALQGAVRDGFNRVGLPSERGDHMVTALAAGLKGLITIPNVVGDQLVAAMRTLKDAGASVGGVTVVASLEPLDEVLTMSVAPGAFEVFQNVNLQVSEGSIAVPDVVDDTEAVGTAAILAAGLSLGVRTEATDAVIVLGNIISTNPAAAALLLPGTAVDYVISTGP
jgi:hypothetical protein